MNETSFNPYHDEFVEKHREQFQQLRGAIEQVLPHDHYVCIENATGQYWQHHQQGQVVDIKVPNPRLDRVTVVINDQYEVILSFRFAVVTDSYYDMWLGVQRMRDLSIFIERRGAGELVSKNDDRPFLIWELPVSLDDITETVRQVSTTVIDVNNQQF